MTERIHRLDSRIVIQVGAGFGRVIRPSMIGANRPAAPSEVPYHWDPSITCREITKAEIAEIVVNFCAAAHVIKDAGFDGIQVHAVHEGLPARPVRD